MTSENNVVQLSDHRRDPHLAGTIRCTACKHEWIGVRKVGTLDIECPNCGCLRGQAKFNISAPIGATWLTCVTCGEHDFEIVISRMVPGKVYALCIACGAETWDLAPP